MGGLRLDGLGLALKKQRETESDEAGQTDAPLQEIALTLIDPDPDQPRKQMDGIEELAASIKANGLIQPIGVRKHPANEGRYMIVFGERRYRAHLLLGELTIKCVFPELKEERSLAMVQFAENMASKRLNAYETMLEIQRLHDKKGYSFQEISAQAAMNRTHVAHYYECTTLPPKYIEAMREGVVQNPRVLVELYKADKKYGGAEELLIVGKAEGGISLADVSALIEKQQQASRAEDNAPTTKKSGTAAAVKGEAGGKPKTETESDMKSLVLVELMGGIKGYLVDYSATSNKYGIRNDGETLWLTPDEFEIVAIKSKFSE
jgi:ParB family transcriptional regulator, chromosome partitioning protein